MKEALNHIILSNSGDFPVIYVNSLIGNIIWISVIRPLFSDNPEFVYFEIDLFCSLHCHELDIEVAISSCSFTNDEQNFSMRN